MNQKQQYLVGALGLGLLFTASWAGLLKYVPAGPVQTILNYVMFFMSIFIIALPDYIVLKLFITRSLYAAVAAAVIWVTLTFGVKLLLMWLLSGLRLL